MFMSSVTMPHLSVPFEIHKNPAAEAAKQATWNWVRAFDLIRSSAAHREFEATKIWDLAALCYPEASADRLILVSQWLSYMHVQSAYFVTVRAGRQSRKMQMYADDCVALMRDSRLATVREDGALMAAFAELWSRLRLEIDDDLAGRFIAGVEAYLRGFLWAVENRAYNYVPTEGEYREARRDTNSFRLFSLLCEVAIARRIDAAVHEHPALTALLATANKAMSWTNDLYRMARFADRRDSHNIVAVLKQQYGISQQDAVNRVGQDISDAIQLLMSQREALPDEPSMRVYADSIVGTLAGVIEWQQTGAKFAAEHVG